MRAGADLLVAVEGLHLEFDVATVDARHLRLTGDLAPDRGRRRGPIDSRHSLAGLLSQGLAQ